MCKNAGHRMKLLTSITKAPISLMGYLFVDDANIMQGADNINTSKEDLIPNFQEFMKRWNGGIRASGGEVCPNKTEWFLIDFKWNGSDYEYQSKNNLYLIFS